MPAVTELNLPKNWLKLTLPKSNWDIEIVSGLLYLWGSSGINETENAIEAYFPVELQNQINQNLRLLCQERQLAPDFCYEIIQAQPWRTNWQIYFKPQRITARIGVRPYWEKPQKNVPLEIVIKPGMAFGTGTHVTTQLALELLEEYLHSGERILDAGCGTGILTIAALKLGARMVSAWDIDPQIEDNFYENLNLNQITAGWQLHIGDVTQLTDWDYDLVLSNIERQVNELVFKRIVESGRRPFIIFTGLLASDYAHFESLVVNYEREIECKRVKDEWLALVVR